MLKVITSQKELIKELKANTHKGLGFVPTMGNLHQGHLSLVEASLRIHELTIVSIFVNPTQFGEGEDFDNYPRTLQKDTDKIKAIDSKNKIIIFAPTQLEDIYSDPNTLFKVNGPTAILEGAVRPTHFDGVTTIVKALFDLINPTEAFFGKKDYQQVHLIKELVKQYNLKTKITALPTIREDSGLAMSSRNGYLSDIEKEAALKLQRTLKEIEDIIKTSSLSEAIEATLKIKNEDSSFNYLEIRNRETLSNIDSKTQKLVILGNMSMNGIRLLDNIEVDIN